MAPTITPEMWGYMAGMAAMEKSAVPAFKKKKKTEGGGKVEKLTAAQRKSRKVERVARQAKGKAGRGSGGLKHKAKRVAKGVGRAVKEYGPAAATGSAVGAGAAMAQNALDARKARKARKAAPKGLVGTAKKHLKSVGRAAKKHWKPLAAGSAALGAAGAAYGAYKSRGKKKKD